MSIIKHTDDAILAKVNLTISVAVARKHGFYAGILYAYFLGKQREQEGYGDTANKRLGVKWIPSLSIQQIHFELPIFADLESVKRVAGVLGADGLILRETTGKFLEEHLLTGRKRDIASWWHVIPSSGATTKALREGEASFDQAEALGRSIPEALILGFYRKQPYKAADVQGRAYKKLSATELEKVLPMDERTARRHLKTLLDDGVLIPHPVKAKLYRLA